MKITLKIFHWEFDFYF